MKAGHRQGFKNTLHTCESWAHGIKRFSLALKIICSRRDSMTHIVTLTIRPLCFLSNWTNMCYVMYNFITFLTNRKNGKIKTVPLLCHLCRYYELCHPATVHSSPPCQLWLVHYLKWLVLFWQLILKPITGTYFICKCTLHQSLLTNKDFLLHTIGLNTSCDWILGTFSKLPIFFKKIFEGQ